MPKILISAEAFGFGPASKAHAISLELTRRGMECHYVGEGSALEFALENCNSFASILPLDSMAGIASVDVADFDVAVTVMDPYLPLLACRFGVPCVYVDSLFWLWQWAPEREDELQGVAHRLTSASGVSDAIDSLSRIAMHDSQYIGHYLSTIICAQRAPKTSARVRTMRGFRRVQLVDAVIDLSHRAEALRTGWLASASGMVNPLLPMDAAVSWVRTTVGLLEEAADVCGISESIGLAGNRTVLSLAADIASDRVRLMPLDHAGMLEAMNSAIACITPPGLTTMLECAAYRVPILLLPEQHYAHVSNYREVSQFADSTETFPHALIDPEAGPPQSNNVLDETLKLSDRLAMNREERGPTWKRMVGGLAEGMELAIADRPNLVQAQESAMRRFVGGYGGAAQVANVLQAYLPERAG